MAARTPGSWHYLCHLPGPEKRMFAYSRATATLVPVELSAKRESFVLYCYFPQTANASLVKIPVPHILEVRDGIHHRDLINSGTLAAFVNPHERPWAFTIFYGRDFEPKAECFIFDTKDKYQKWKDHLTAVVEARHESLPESTNPDALMYSEMAKMNQFLSVCLPGQQVLTFGHIQSLFLTQGWPTLKVSELRRYIMDVTGRQDHQLTWTFTRTDAERVYLHVMQVQEAKVFFNKYACEGRMAKTDLQRFLREVQMHPRAFDEAWVNGIMRTYSRAYNQADRWGSMYSIEWELDDFHLFLFSRDNDIFDPQHDKVYQDMTQPLSHYYINSSYMTHQVGDRLTGVGSVEACIRALRAGCRCIEVSVSNGVGDDPPRVTRGLTNRGTVYFHEIVEAIRDHAFATSPYPVILSLDNNCSASYQVQMASILRSTLGELLDYSNVQQNPDVDLPSPEALMYKVLIKDRVVRGREPVDVTAMSGSLIEPMDNSIMASAPEMKGILYTVPDSPGAQRVQYFGELNSDSLLLVPDQDTGDSEVVAGYVTSSTFYDTAVGTSGSLNSVPHPMDADEFNRPEEQQDHWDELWYHPVVMSADEAATLFPPERRQEGSFLCASQEKLHLPSRCASPKNPLTLVETAGSQAPNSQIRLKILLTTPVPVPQRLENEPWYFGKSVDRARAETVLWKSIENNTFLVRYNDRTPDNPFYVISVMCHGGPRHFQIRQRKRLFTLGCGLREHGTIRELVEYYATEPLPIPGRQGVVLSTPARISILSELGNMPPVEPRDSTYVAVDQQTGSPVTETIDTCGRMERRRLPRRPLVRMVPGTQLKFLGRDRGNIPGPNEGRIPVTIKYVPIEKRTNFDTEVDALLSLQHPNILNLLAWSDKDTNLLLLLDYADMGSLENYLRDEGTNIQLDQQLWFCRELAQGLGFVAKANIVHRALTPSRIRVHAGNHYFASLKIADFEYSRDIGDRESFVVAPDMPDQVPIEWFAPECLSRVAPKFSVGSDVWAYAVTCWVIFSNGVFPTPEMRANRTPPTSWLLNAVANDFLRPPQACPVEMHRILTRCWATKTDNRPNPEYISDQLTRQLEGRNGGSGQSEMPAYEEVDTVSDIQRGLSRAHIEDEQDDTVSVNGGPAASTPNTTQPKNVVIHLAALNTVARDPYRESCFKLVPKQQAPTMTLSTAPSPSSLTPDQRDAVNMWVDAISRAINIGTNNNTTQLSVSRNSSVTPGVRQYKLSRVPELASLVRYCQVVKVFHSPTAEMDRKPYQMSSLTENQALSQFKSHRPLIDYHTKCLSRVYPNIWKVRAENFNPVPYWNYGFQMTSLNFQTPGRDLQVNQGRFRCNGRSGYVLKPAFLRTRQFFNPRQPTAVPVTSPKEIAFTIGTCLWSSCWLGGI